MNEQSAQQHPDRVIVELAGRQHGVIHWQQLIDRGISRTAIDSRLRSGFLIRLYRGVYAVGGRTLTQAGHFLAAVFALGEGSALSHHSAAANLGLRATSSAKVAVTVPNRGGRKRREDITVHYGAIHPWEIDDVDGIPTTIVARTLMDLAEHFPPRVVEKAIARAEQLRSFDLDQIGRVLAAHPHRVGAKRLIRILSLQPVTRHDADEGIEELFLAIVDDIHLERPVIKPDIYIPGRASPYQPDFFWPDLKLIVETDGRQTHLTPTAFESDPVKRNDLTLARYKVLSYTYLQVTRAPDWVAGQLRDAGVPTRGGGAAR